MGSLRKVKEVGKKEDQEAEKVEQEHLRSAHFDWENRHECEWLTNWERYMIEYWDWTNEHFEDLGARLGAEEDEADKHFDEQDRENPV